VCLAPLIIGTTINAGLQAPIITLAALALYIGAFLALDGRRFELWRASSFLGARVAGAGRRRPGRQAIYLLVEIPVGCLSIAVVLAWIVISVRNVLFYPVFGWTSYPDPSWGGPTPIGAVVLHLAAGLVTLFGGPWLIRSIARLQGSLIERLLSPAVPASD